MSYNSGNQIIIVPSGCLENTEITLQCKSPVEAVYYQFSMANRLSSTEIIDDVQAQPADEKLIVDQITFSGQIFRARISAGTMNTKTGIRFLVTTRDKSVREFDVTLPVAPAGIVGSGSVGSYVIGNTGPVGPRGRAGTITIGEVTASETDGDAQVTNIADDDIDVKLNFVLPRGKEGEKGDQGDITEVLIKDADPEPTDAKANIIWLNNQSGDLFKTVLVDDQYEWNKEGNLKGNPGSIIYSGDENPIVEDYHKTGDIYINLSTSELFNFAKDQWVQIASLKGDQGERGSLWFADEGEPLVKEEYQEQDLYLNTATNQVFVFKDNQWTETTNLQGEVGPRGDTPIIKVGNVTEGEADVEVTTDVEANTATFDFTIPKGGKGDKGDTPIIKVGNVTEGKADVDVTTDAEANTATFDFTIPKGDKGDKGDTPIIEVGKVTEGKADVKVTTNAEANTATFDFTIPKGEQGDAGFDGTRIIVNTVNPTEKNAEDNVVWLNSETGELFESVLGSNGLYRWNKLGNLKGNAGSHIYSGPAAPSVCERYNVDDLYLNMTSSDLLSYNGNQWVKISNLKGERGERGSLWSSGEENPVFRDTYKSGDFYLNTTTFSVFYFNGTYWESRGSIKGADGVNGVNGENGLDGTSIITSQGDPDIGSADQNKNVIWINTLNWNVKRTIKRNGSWIWIDIGNIQGEQGKSGLQGLPGEPGKDGASIVTSQGDPEIGSADQNKNVIWINTLNWNVKRTIYKNGSWIWIDIGNIQGEQGKPGPQGEKGDSGPRWYSGTTVPDVSTGLKDKRGKPRPGDMYLYINNDKNDVSAYILSEDKSWEGPIATVGVAGPPGLDGKDGKDGAPGLDGKDGKDGAPGLDGKDGKDGAPGLDGKDGKDGAPGLDGKDGKDGAPGLEGKDGKDGAPGLQGPKGDGYINDGSVDLNVKSITSDESMITSDGNGALQAQHLKSENGWFYTDTTDYGTGSVYYDKMPYASFRGWKMIDDQIWKNQGQLNRDLTNAEGKFEVFVHPDGFPDAQGTYNMSLAIDAFVGENHEKRRLAVVGTDRVVGHETVEFMGSSIGTPSDPFYVCSRLLRILPKRLSDLRMIRTNDIDTITNNYMAGSIGLSTNYFTKTEDDKTTDGFITPVIWDKDTDDSSQARPLGLPYIPADKKDTLLDTANIPTGTQSFDLNTQKPCWWNGASWDKPVLEGKHIDNFVSTNIKTYWINFIDSYNGYMKFPNMLNNKTAAEMNGGVQYKYFERTVTDAELEKYIYPEIDANSQLTEDQKVAEKSKAKATRTSSGLFPDYSVMQAYNPHATKAINVNNFYFDGTLVTTGALNLGKQTSLNKLQILQDGAIALNSDNKPAIYNASSKKWNNLVLEDQGVTRLVSNTVSLYTLSFIDSWNAQVNFPNMWGAKYGARTQNNGITCRYFEKTRSAAERKAIETEIANEITDATKKQTELDRIASTEYVDFVSKGLFPNYNMYQTYNRNLGINLNNYYFDGTIKTTGPLCIGDISSYTSDTYIEHNTFGLDNGVLKQYDSLNKVWNVYNITEDGSSKDTVLSTDQTYTYLGGDFILLGRSSSWTNPAWVAISKGAIDPKTSKGTGLQYWDDATLTWTVPKTGVLTLNYNFGFNNNAGTGIDGTIFQANDELWIAADKKGSAGVPSNVIKHCLTPYQFESNGKTLYKPALYLNGSLSMSVAKGDKIQFKVAWYPKQLFTSTNWDQRIQISPAGFTFFVS